ncbi:MAG TPA: hypothetical protein VHU61_06180 [Solirubrobacteraceae bacterium]|jgi:hypothetical protein|nr:hypothetical protein [Solirubrobacteraceae bacterium]
MPKNRCSLVRLPRIALLLTTFTLAFCALTANAFAASGASKPRKVTHASHKSKATKKAHESGVLPAQGMFDNCDLSNGVTTTCDQDLLQMHQAGLQVAVMDAQWATLDELSAYASYAQSIGMSVMWEFNDPGYWGGAWIGSSAAADWSAFSTACGCTASDQVLDYMIQWLSALPGTYGYYAADDSTLEPNQLAGLRQYVAEIKSVDPDHMVMVGSAQGQGTSFYSSGATIGNEIYPETTRSLMPAGQNLAIWQSVQQSITQDQRAATRQGTSSAFILQAFSFGDNLSDGQAVGACTASMSQAQCASRLQFPSAGVELALRNAALQYAQPKLILWYTYGQASQGGHWADFTSAVTAPYPVSASAARAKRNLRKSSRKHSARRRNSSGHQLAI